LTLPQSLPLNDVDCLSCSQKTLADKNTWYGPNLLDFQTNGSITSGLVQVKIFKLYTIDHLVHILNESAQGSIVSSFLDNLPIDVVMQTIKTLLAEPGLKKGAKEVLNGFMDVSDLKLRQQLQKACDSNNASDRLSAMQGLINATHKSKNAKELTKTLKFLRTKLKNEVSSQRASVLRALLTKESGMLFLFPHFWI